MGFDAQGDANKVVNTLTTMLCHASIGLDLSQYFGMLCSQGLSSEHHGIKVLAYELVRVIASDDAHFAQLVAPLARDLTAPASTLSPEIRVCALGTLACLPLGTFQAVCSDLGPMMHLFLSESSPSIVREAAVNATAHAVLSGRPLMITPTQTDKTSLAQRHASESANLQLTQQNWTAIKERAFDTDPFVAAAAFSALRELILVTCRNHMPEPTCALRDASLKDSLSATLRDVIKTNGKDKEILMARMCTLPSELQWTAVLPVCFCVVLGDPESTLYDLTGLTVAKPVVRLCQSVLQPFLAAVDPALVYEVADVLVAMKAFGVPAHDIAVNLLRLLRRPELQHACINVVEKILDLLSCIPSGQQVGLVEALLVSISMFLSKSVRIDAFILVFKCWFGSIVDELSLIDSELPKTATVPERYQVLSKAYEAKMIGSLWRSPSWVSEVWRQEDDSNKVREEIHVCLVECVRALKQSCSNQVAWSCICWEVVELCISGVTWNCGGRPHVFVAWLRLLHTCLANVVPSMEQTLAAALNQTISALQRVSGRLRVTAAYTIAQFIPEKFGDAIVDQALDQLIATLHQRGLEDDGDWVGSALITEGIVNGFEDNWQPLAPGSLLGVLDMVHFSLLQFAIQCPSRHQKVVQAVSSHASSPSLNPYERDLCQRTLSKLNSVAVVCSQTMGAVNVATVRQALFVHADTNLPLEDGILPSSAGNFGRSQFDLILEASVQRHLKQLKPDAVNLFVSEEVEALLGSSTVQSLLESGQDSKDAKDSKDLKAPTDMVHLTGPSDPLAVHAIHTCDAHTHTLKFTVWITNRTSDAIAGVKVRIGVEGGLTYSDHAFSASRAIPTLDGRKSVRLTFTFDVLRFARQQLHVRLLVPVTVEPVAHYSDEDGGDLKMMASGADMETQVEGVAEVPDTEACIRCVAYPVPIRHLTRPLPITPAAFPSTFSNLMFALRFPAMMREGVSFDTLQQQLTQPPFSLVSSRQWARSLQLGLCCESWFGDTIVLTLTATHTLEHTDHTPRVFAGSVLETGAATSTQQWAGVAILELRTSSENALQAVENCFDTWFKELSGDLLVPMELAKETAHSLGLPAPWESAINPAPTNSVLESFKATLETQS